MKKLFTTYLPVMAFSVLVFLSSCENSSDPNPMPQADFKVTTVAPEVDLEVQFESLGINSNSVAWDFGDGTTDSLTLDPAHTYTAAGTYQVVMRAYSQDGQVSEQIKEVNVGTRYLTGMAIISISMTDQDGNPWDDDMSGPDVLFRLAPSDGSQTEQGFFADSLNVGSLSTPLGITDQDLIEPDYELADNLYVVLLEEIDTSDETAEPRFMFGLEFNPKTPDPEVINDTKREDGTGDMTIPFIVSQDYQLLINYVVR